MEKKKSELNLKLKDRDEKLKQQVTGAVPTSKGPIIPGKKAVGQNIKRQEPGKPSEAEKVKLKTSLPLFRKWP